MIFSRVAKKSPTKKGKIIQSSLFSFLFLYYSASATTSSTSGTILFSKPSIPAFKVMVDDGQPLHDPRSSTVTTPSSNERYAMAPPSCSTAGRTSSCSTCLIFISTSVPSKSTSSVCSIGFTTNSDSTAPFTKSFNNGSISGHSTPSLFVTVTKLLAKKTPSTKLNLNSSRANSDS